MSDSYRGPVPGGYNLTVPTSTLSSALDGQVFPTDREGELVIIPKPNTGFLSDGIYYFDHPTDSTKVLTRIINGSIRAAHCGIFATPLNVNDDSLSSANTDALIRAANHAAIQTIVFDEPQGGKFYFQGTFPLDQVVPNKDKLVFEFKVGNMWAGSPNNPFIFRGGTIKADDTSQIFHTGSSITVRPYAFANGYATVHHWGAFPDTGTDQSYMFQQALDCIVANSRTKKLTIPLSGNYIVKNLCAIKVNQNNGNDYISFSLEGSTPPTDGLGGSVLQNDDPSSCTLAVQAGNNILIKNLTFTGTLQYIEQIGSGVNFVNCPDSEWLKTSNGQPVRDNQYSPHAGIAIDPFMSSVSSADRYPGLSDKYVNPYGTATSNFTIENCNFFRFSVAIMESPSGMPNGDNVIFKNGVSYNCRTFWGCGNLQARANQIENLYIFGATKFFVNTGQYGTQVGSAPEIKNCSLNGIKYLYYVNGEFSGISFTGCYGENVWSFGKCTGSLPVTFNSCQFNLKLPTEGGLAGTALVLAEGKGAFNFIGGKIEYPNNDNYMSFPFNTPQVSFKGSTIKTALPFQVINYRFTNVNIEGVMWTYGPLAQVILSENAHFSDLYIQSYYARPFLPGSVITDYFFPSTYHSVGKKFAKDLIENAAVSADSVDTARAGCHFIAADPGAYQVGDAIYADYPIADPYGFFTTQPFAPTNPPSVQGTAIGYVSSVDLSTSRVNLSFTPDGINLSTQPSYDLYIIRIPFMQSRGIGSTTVGSNILTNVIYQDQFVFGTHIKSAGLPLGTRTLGWQNNDPGTHNVILSRAAIATTQNAQYYDAEVRQRFDNYPTYYFGGYYNFFNLGRIYLKGDEIYNVDAATYPNVRSWYIVKEGQMTGSVPPTYVTVS